MGNRIVVFGGNHHNTLGLIRSLGRCGHSVIVLLEPCELTRCILKKSKYITKLFALKSVEEGVELLYSKLGNLEEKTVVLTASDTAASALDLNYNRLSDRCVFFNAGKPGVITKYLNKSATFPLAKEAGLDLIETSIVNPGDSLPCDIKYPCLIKGNNSTRSNKEDMCICYSRQELEGAVKDNVQYLVQDYLVKEYELDIIGFSYNNGKDVFIPAVVRKIRDEIDRQSMYERLDPLSKYPDLDVVSIKRLISKIGYEGIFSVELIKANGKYYFLEVNLRNDGCAFAYTAAGFNYPAMWVKYALGETFSGELNEERFSKPLFIIHENDIFNVRDGKVSFIRWLKEYITADAHFVLDVSDIKPYIWLLGIYVAHALKKVANKLCHI